MTNPNHYYHSKRLGQSLVIILSIVFVIIVMMIVVSLMAPKVYISTQTHLWPDQSLSKVWHASNDIQSLSRLRSNQMKIRIIDTTNLEYIEYYSPTDSIHYRTLEIKPNRYRKYQIDNWKYEQFHTIELQIDSTMQGIQTKWTEKSIYQNVWARVYHTMIAPSTILDFERYKLKSILDNEK